MWKQVCWEKIRVCSEGVWYRCHYHLIFQIVQCNWSMGGDISITVLHA